MLAAGGALGEEGAAAGEAGLGTAGPAPADLGGALGVGAGAEETLGTAGAGGTVTGLAGVAPPAAPGGELGAFG